jgi:predicted nucleotidyltransferase
MPFVSFRLSETDRNRLRTTVAQEGRTLQEFMEKIVHDSLSSHSTARKPRLAETVRTLRQHKDELCRRRVNHLWIFGSVARGEERDDSDVDIVVELDPEARISLTSFVRLQLDLSDLLGHRVDLATWKSLRDHIVDDVKNDAVMVF